MAPWYGTASSSRPGRARWRPSAIWGRFRSARSPDRSAALPTDAWRSADRGVRDLTPGGGFRDKDSMDFRATPTEEAFRRQVRDWLLTNLPEGWGTPGYPKPDDAAAKVAFAPRWR